MNIGKYINYSKRNRCKKIETVKWYFAIKFNNFNNNVEDTKKNKPKEITLTFWNCIMEILNKIE